MSKFKVGDKIIQRFPAYGNVLYYVIIKKIDKDYYYSDYINVNDPTEPKGTRIINLHYSIESVDNNSFLAKGKLIEALYL